MDIRRPRAFPDIKMFKLPRWAAVSIILGLLISCAALVSLLCLVFWMAFKSGGVEPLIILSVVAIVTLYLVKR